MANFDLYTAKSTSARQALDMLILIRSIYQSGKLVQAALAAYQAGSDTAFVASVNALFTANERTELGQMATQIANLIQDWEASHMGALSGGN